MSREQEDLPHPQMSVNTMLALHNIVSRLSEALESEGLFSFSGDLETGLSHRSVFPVSNCEGLLSIVSLDNLMDDMEFKCSKGDLEYLASSIFFSEIGFPAPNNKILDENE